MGRSTIAPGRRAVDGVAVTYLRRVASRGWLSLSLGVGDVVRSGFDVVHCFGLRDGLVTTAALQAQRRKIPVVLEPMGMAIPRIRSRGVKRSFDVLTRAVTRRAAVTIATSELEADELGRLGYRNIEVRHNPIELPAASKHRPAAKYDICYVGRLHKKKRLGDVIEALAANPEWTAVIAGPDEDGTAESLRATAMQKGVAQRLTMRGWVDAAERRTLIESSRCFVLPSETENFGNAAAEAIALGTPAVVTDQCGVASLVEQTGFGMVVRVGSALTHGVGAVLQTDFSHSGREKVLQRYAPDAVALAQRAIYEREPVA